MIWSPKNIAEFSSLQHTIGESDAGASRRPKKPEMPLIDNATANRTPKVRFTITREHTIKANKLLESQAANASIASGS